jgi:hypothetical protein
MLYDFELTVPAGTPETTPVSQDVTMEKGIISEIRVSFPPGPARTVYVRVKHGTTQILPKNATGSLNYDNMTIISRVVYELLTSPYTLTVQGWAPDATFDHKIRFQITEQSIDNRDYHYVI